MNRLMEYTVFVGLVTACRRATSPTRRSPFFANATTDGVVRKPSAFAITLGSPPSMTATHEFVVPRSMPMTLPMLPPLASADGHAAPGGARVARNVVFETAQLSRPALRFHGPWPAPPWAPG